MAGVNKGPIRYDAGYLSPMKWHSYVVAMAGRGQFFQSGVRRAAVECMNRLAVHVKNGKSWSQAVELRKAELEAADGA